jgi:predicted DNA-binding protein (MmcQ/YjbR family)
MDDEKLLDVAEETANALQSASWEHPFGPDWEVFKVGGKVFLLTTQVPGRAVITVKCDPEIGAELVQTHQSISPGYHMNKRHWVSAWPGEDMDEDLVRDLVQNSYRLVVGSLPRARRPSTAPLHL